MRPGYGSVKLPLPIGHAQTFAINFLEEKLHACHKLSIPVSDALCGVPCVALIILMKLKQTMADGNR